MLYNDSIGTLNKLNQMINVSKMQTHSVKKITGDRLDYVGSVS